MTAKGQTASGDYIVAQAKNRLVPLHLRTPTSKKTAESMTGHQEPLFSAPRVAESNALKK